MSMSHYIVYDRGEDKFVRDVDGIDIRRFSSVTEIQNFFNLRLDLFENRYTVYESKTIKEKTPWYFVDT